MWKNEHRGVWIRNILFFLVLAAASFFLVSGILEFRRQERAENAALQQANASQRQELSDTRQNNIELVQQAYEQDLAVIRQYLPGIVCWGDSLTAGSSGNVSYPLILQQYIDNDLCNVYNLRSTLDTDLQSARADWDSFVISIPVANLGAGQENSATVLGRSGSAPYIVSRSFTIPAGTDSTIIEFTAADGSTVNPLTAGNAGINPVTIAGIEGTLSMVAENDGWLHYSYRFTRSAPGEAVTVSSGSEIITACAEQYRDYLHIIWLGTYDGYRSPDRLVQDVNLLLSRQIGNSDRYLVLGPCTINGSWTMEGSYSLDTIDSAMMQAFGSHYINTRKYLLEDGLHDAGLTASEEDKKAMQQGFVPSTFRSASKGADLNGIAYKLIGKIVYERMDILGYFDEVRSELGLSRTTATD